VTRLIPLTLRGPAGELEALLQVREPDDGGLTALVCHPHPLYGGTMHNKVVHRVAAAMEARGAAVLRFNFRGVGRSEGRSRAGEEELEDAKAALAHLRERYPGARQWLAGFSFGAWVAAMLAGGEAGIEQLVLVAPPVVRSNFEILRSLAVPKLIIQGTRDEVCPLAELEGHYAAWLEPKRLIKVEGATHFFDRKLGALAEALDQGLPPPVKGVTS
jgi:hypothetical protein